MSYSTDPMAEEVASSTTSEGLLDLKLRASSPVVVLLRRRNVVQELRIWCPLSALEGNPLVGVCVSAVAYQL